MSFWPGALLLSQEFEEFIIMTFRRIRDMYCARLSRDQECECIYMYILLLARLQSVWAMQVVVAKGLVEDSNTYAHLCIFYIIYIYIYIYLCFLLANYSVIVQSVEVLSTRYLLPNT